VGVTMFGHDDHNQNSDNQATPDVHVNEALLQPENFDHEPTSGESNEGAAAAVENAPGAVEITPSDPGTNDNTAVIITPPVQDDAASPVGDDTVTVVPSAIGSDSSDDPLLSIKRDALQSLSPLLGHLDQTPEEKFRTTMMLIQATDNKSLIKEAYSAAKEISDEKVRAQALLDVVNEINYFTQGK
jgi:hypothetical protein